ncbi:hypothetical protein SKAU_G00192900 [Synaphobranchus kaupii]|uniref:Gypsy retrotransposon integrase-like protein 1 n=1 Tax=Synaphobranchus kaupii TaxID=118154 RepID=A0A9Q1FE23_SYNKA|nr:hypothetical protein SKAU_G00192900 [Synaphobranchus kaupii]
MFSTLRTFIQDGWPVEVDASLLPYHRVRNELSCWGEGCLARGHRAVIPATLRTRVLHMAHEGHLGVVKVKQRCRDTVWWPHIDQDVEDLVKNCTCCLLSGKTVQPATAPLTPLQWPSAPWEHIQVDLCGELHGAPAHTRYLLVASKHSTTGVSPALLMIGRELKQPLDCLRAKSAPARVSPGLQRAKVQVRSSQAQMKQRFDTSRRVRDPSLSAGDWVRVKHAYRQNKLQSYWSVPRHVTQQLGPATYRLDDGTRWHLNRLHRVRARTGPASSLSPAASLSWQPAPGTEGLGVNLQHNNVCKK